MAAGHGDMLCIEIWDTGIGIATDQQEEIFQAYHQVGNAARNSGQGIGLGLSIVQRLGALLDHQARVRSTPGKGSVFTIEVRLAIADFSRVNVRAPVC